MSRLPIDRNREFREYDYPKEPNLYTPLRHFGQRFKEDERFLTEEIVRKCIKDGDLRDNGDGCACFRLEWGEGVAYYLIAGWHYDGYRILVTAWPHVHHRESALDSGRWSNQELDKIEELNERCEKKFEHRYPAYANWIREKMTKTPSKYVAEERDWEKKSWLYEKYWGEMLSLTEIAEETEVTAKTIRERLIELGIPRRVIGYSREGTISPFRGFYGPDEASRSDSESNKVYDSEADFSNNPTEHRWQKSARKYPRVGDRAIIKDD